MRGVAWVLLFCAVLACASAAYAQKADGSASVSDSKAVNKNDIKPPASEPKAPQPQDSINTTSNTIIAPPVARQEGPNVTGSYFKLSGSFAGPNRFDPSLVEVPTGFGNSESNREVAILDTWIEFGADFGKEQTDHLDISTNGLITLNVTYPGTNNTYFEGNYTLESAWFANYRAALLVSSNGLPAAVSVTVSGASDLAAGVLKIHIPTFNASTYALGGINFQLEYQLALRECEPGEDAPCCDPATYTPLNGTVCRTGAGDCEADTTCNGVDPGCPITYADGKKCPYYPLDEIIDRFKPFNPKGWPAHAMAAEPSYGYQGHPPCTGKCNTGKCVLDKSHPGCCTVGPWKYLAAEAQKATASGETVKAMAAEHEGKEPKGDVYCWEGEKKSEGYGKSNKGASQATPKAGAVKN